MRHSCLLWVGVGLAFILGIFAHIDSLSEWFTSYDSLALIETSRITSFEDIYTIFTTPLLSSTTYVESGLFYRPVVNITYAVEYWVWGVDPFGYHLTNLLLHGLASGLVVLTIYSLTGSYLTGTLTGVLFAIHPLSIDTVPAISRRQDILLAVFGLFTLWLLVEGYRREDNRLRTLAVVAYGLALFSKETAIVVGPLAFLWVLFQEQSLREVKAYFQAFYTVSPLAAVAILYLIIRLAVLEGVGGYTHDPPLAQILLFPMEYMLSLIYQADLFSVVRVFSPLVLLIIIFVTVTLYVLLFNRDRSVFNVTYSSVPLIGGLVAVPGVVTLFVLVSNLLSSSNVLNSQMVSWYAMGTTFAVATVSALLVALLSKSSRNGNQRRLNVFFTIWMVIPLPLFFIAKQFAFRDAYFFVIPFIALAVTCFVEALPHLENLQTIPFNNTADRVLILAVLVLLIPTVAASPLLHNDSGWGSSSDVTNESLFEINNSVAQANESTPVTVIGMPTRVQHNPRRLGQARKVTMLQPHSVRAWSRLHGMGNKIKVGGFRSFDTAPQNVSSTTYKRKQVVVRLRYS